MPRFYEFFAGGGMARLGLGKAWECIFANDISPMKSAAYRANFPDANKHLSVRDINSILVSDLPERADMIWGSFPCQDLSLAGSGKGLDGKRSGLIWKLLSLSEELKHEGRAPKMMVLENVSGLLNSRGGQDFYDILAELNRQGYLFGALLMDAVHFLPQSRPRVFLFAVDPNQVTVFPKFTCGWHRGTSPWGSPRLEHLWKSAPLALRNSWIWWDMPSPKKCTPSLTDVLDREHAIWDTPEYTARLLSLMSPLNLAKVRYAQNAEGESVGTLYRRTRLVDGVRQQRVEVRFDGVSGCLRTPSGGSSRQRILSVNGEEIRSRLLTAREAATLMGLPRNYKLPLSYNDAYQIAGDGVAVPVVSWLSSQLLLPMLQASQEASTELEPICA